MGHVRAPDAVDAFRADDEADEWAGMAAGAAKGAAINAVRLLPELRRAGRAQARLLPSQACGDGADVGDFAGTETIDVGGAGAALLGSPLVLRECRSGCKQREE